jgi:Helicase conserved C-terminal domain
VAEALVEQADPLATVLDPGPLRPAGPVVRALARSLAPPLAPHPPPGWLLPEQRAPFGRVVAAVERYGGALLADPVGSGKTFIALAVAQALAPGRTVAIVPAALRRQWQERAEALGVPVGLHSHEALSRGRTPAGHPALVLLDECHRFRHAGIRRYRTLARWLVGRRLLLLSATPVVNRLADLGQQLRLGVRDDALAARGVPSLRAALAAGDAPPALGDIVHCRPRPSAQPARRTRTLVVHPSPREVELLAAIGCLTLSRNGGVASLIRATLWRALGSSLAALAGALRRYRALLQHAAAARSAGRRIGRETIRRFAGEQLEQLVLWQLLPAGDSPVDLALDDLASVTLLIDSLPESPPLPRLAPLRQLLADRRPSLVFTGSRDTLEALRLGLADLRPAWVTGERAGAGHTPVPREVVLGWFRPEPPRDGSAGEPGAGSRPFLLLATDVAAEGLDLQRAERVVHFDLPWTSVRLDQREGRAARLGARAREVEAVRFGPWPALEARLRQELALRRTRSLGAAAGLDDDGRWLFRWRVELAEWAGPGSDPPGYAVTAGDADGWLVGLALDRLHPEGDVLPAPASLLWIGDDGRISEDPAETSELLLRAGGAGSTEAATTDRAACLAALAPLVRQRLAAATRTSWLARCAPPEQRLLVRRVRRLAAEAARQRNRARLDLADRSLAWLAGGVTAGEAAEVARLARAPAPLAPPQWRELLARPREHSLLLPRLTGVIRVTSFPPCQRSTPCCSTSTAP